MGRHRPYDSDPSKQSFNSHSNKHPLGDRARKLDKGILIVRFENPFNIWCTSCNGHIAQGVRFNAEKSKVGNYLSTPIWNFRCKCHLCQNWFEIRTDPKVSSQSNGEVEILRVRVKCWSSNLRHPNTSLTLDCLQNTQYICHSGARRKEEDWDPEEEGNGAFIADTEGKFDEQFLWIHLEVSRIFSKLLTESNATLSSLICPSSWSWKSSLFSSFLININLRSFLNFRIPENQKAKEREIRR